MRQIRQNTFETNSSSTHSICISKNPVVDVRNKHVYFGSGEFGWSTDTVTDTASYLYTAMVTAYSPQEFREKLEKLKNILDKYGITYDFSPVEEIKSDYTPDYSYLVFTKDRYASVDHAAECIPFIESLLNDEDMLLRYLFGDSCIYTGNDNSNEYGDDCYRAFDTIWDDEKCEDVPNYKHDEEHYDYFFKGN